MPRPGTAPSGPIPEAPPNGGAEDRAWEDTDRHNLGTLAASTGGGVELTEPSDGSNPFDKLAEALLEAQIKKGGGGGGDGSGPIDLKKFRRGNWWVNLLIGVVVAASGAFAAYKATEARSVTNENGVQQNKKAVKQVEDDVAEVKKSVDDVGEKVDSTYRVQVQLVEGIDQLKAEAQTDKQRRLEDKVKSLERENRRLERNR